MSKDLKNIKLYQEELMEHYNYPKNRSCQNVSGIEEITLLKYVGIGKNPSCGDSVTIGFNLIDNVINIMLFWGSGCVISQATASMLTEICINKNLNFINSLNKDDIIKLIGIELGPNRLRCALLALDALQEAAKATAYVK